MTDTVTSQNIDLSYWDTLYNRDGAIFPEVNRPEREADSSSTLMWRLGVKRAVSPLLNGAHRDKCTLLEKAI